MKKEHQYSATIKWTGNNDTGTDNYKNYQRSHQLLIENKSNILVSSDSAFRGDKKQSRRFIGRIIVLMSQALVFAFVFRSRCYSSGV